MIGLGSDEADRLLAEADWDDLSQRLTLHAFKRLRKKSRELAEEFAQTAIERVLSKKYAPWDPARQPDLFLHLGSIVNGLVANHFDASATKAARGKMREAERIADSAESAEARLVEQDFAARFARMVRESVVAKGDEIGAKLLDAMADGIDKPQDLAAAAKMSVDEVYTAKKRLLSHAMAAKAKLESENGHGG
jgi:hypothetical protein